MPDIAVITIFADAASAAIIYFAISILR